MCVCVFFFFFSFLKQSFFCPGPSSLAVLISLSLLSPSIFILARSGNRLDLDPLQKNMHCFLPRVLLFALFFLSWTKYLLFLDCMFSFFSPCSDKTRERERERLRAEGMDRWREEKEEEEEGKLEHFGKEARKWVVFKAKERRDGARLRGKSGRMGMLWTRGGGGRRNSCRGRREGFGREDGFLYSERWRLAGKALQSTR